MVLQTITLGATSGPRSKPPLRSARDAEGGSVIKSPTAPSPARHGVAAPGGNGAAVRRALCSLVLPRVVFACSLLLITVVPAPRRALWCSRRRGLQNTAQPAIRGPARQVVGGLRRCAAERARGARRGLERDAQTGAGPSPARAAIGINRADLYPQVGEDPSITLINASNTLAANRRALEISSCRSTCRTRRTRGPGA